MQNSKDTISLDNLLLSDEKIKEAGITISKPCSLWGTSSPLENPDIQKQIRETAIHSERVSKLAKKILEKK